ncbi:MAG: beta-ketoacyl synthase [Pirellulaceae bacterium]
MSEPPTRRVVITGASLVSPLGNTKEALWDALLNQRSGVRKLESIPTQYLPVDFGAEAWDFTGHISDFGELEAQQKKTIRKGLKVMCREIQMGVATAQRALNDAGLATGDYDSDRTGCICGSDYIMTVPDEFVEGVRNCVGESGFQFSQWAERGLPRVTPLWLLKYLPNMPASHIAIYNDLRGPNNSITLREASANLAVAEAYCTIARGRADTIVVGATGTRIHPLRTVHIALQEELATNSSNPETSSRPFDLNRTGLVLGEGAGAVILEELETATKRGAAILGEVVGYGSSTVRDPDGTAQFGAAIRNSLKQALRTSDLTPAQIGHIHAHGIATRQGDAAEAQAIDSVFGSTNVPVVAAKANFGNLGAGGGMIELIASLLAQQQRRLFRLLNHETPDPDCPIHPAQMGDASGDSFVNLNVSPQAQASAVVVRRFG